MKQFDIYGMGSALVDIEILVSDETLERLGLEKGCMTLVEEAELKKLLDYFESEDKKLACGGSAANTIITAAQLGSRTYFSSRVSNDEVGLFYLEDIERNRVTTNLSDLAAPNAITGQCLVMVTPDAQRTMVTYLGVSSGFSEGDLNNAAIKDSEYLYIEGYLSASPSALNAVLQARHHAPSSVKVVLTLSDPNIVTYCKEALDSIIGDGVDLLFCNEEEVLRFFDTQNIEIALDGLKRISKTFAVTRGASGAVIYDGSQFLKIPAFSVSVKDTTGAGDSFAGAFLYALSKGHGFELAGKCANYAASQVVSQFGPRLTGDCLQRVLDYRKISV